MGRPQLLLLDYHLAISQTQLALDQSRLMPDYYQSLLDNLVNTAQYMAKHGFPEYPLKHLRA
jgi:hypothetical protein